MVNGSSKRFMMLSRRKWQARSITDYHGAIRRERNAAIWKLFSGVTNPTISLMEGSVAPTFTLEAVGSGRVFQLSAYRGRHVLLIFVSGFAARNTRDLVIGVRRHFPDFDPLPLAIIINLAAVPGLLRGAVKNFMESAYRDAAGEIPPGYAPDEHLILLPDWSGKITSAYSFNDSGNEVHLVSISPEGQILADFHGPGAVNNTIALLQKVL